MANELEICSSTDKMHFEKHVDSSGSTGLQDKISHTATCVVSQSIFTNKSGFKCRRILLRINHILFKKFHRVSILIMYCSHY